MVWPWISATKELEWARQFHVDEPFGTPSDDFGAQQRFIGMIMALLPKMQVQAWMQQPDRFQDMWLATTPWLWFGVAGLLLAVLGLGLGLPWRSTRVR